MVLPVLQLFTRLQIPVAVCARPWAQDLLSGEPIEDFIKLSGKLVNDVGSVRAWRRKHPEFIKGLLLPDSLSSALIFKLAGLRSAGYRDDSRTYLLEHPITKGASAQQHAAQQWFALAVAALNAWCLPNTNTLRLPDRVTLNLTPSHLQSASARMSTHNLHKNGFVLIAPTATGLHHGKIKVWSHFESLTALLKLQGHRVVMCPPPHEQAAACAAAPGAELIAPLSLGGFASLAQQAALVVCNDSGVSHLAAAVGARQITIFGVTNPERTRPWAQSVINLGQNGHWPGKDEVCAVALECLKPSELQLPC